MLCLAFICYAIADVLFSYTTIIGAYYYGNPLELLFHMGYMLLRQFDGIGPKKASMIARDFARGCD